MTTFAAHNDLEKHLFAAQAGHIPEDQFFNHLMDCQVFLPVKNTNECDPNKVEPLTIQANELRAYAVFSGPARAKEVIEHFPGFENGMLVDFSWVVEQAMPDLGLCLNPGLDVGIDMTPDMLNHLPKQL